MNDPIKKIVTLLILLFITACSASDKPSYTKEDIANTRLCPEMLYRCLPESQDPEWQKKLAETQFSFHGNDSRWMRFHTMEKMLSHYNIHLKDEKGRTAPTQMMNYANKIMDQHKNTPDAGLSKAYDAALTKTAEFLGKTEQDIMDDNVYQLSEKEERRIKQQRKQRSYQEVIQMLDLYYPDFWGDDSEEEKLHWVMQVEKKNVEYGLIYNDQGSLEIMAQICAILSLDFDKKTVNQPIVDYIKSIREGNHGQLTQTLDYLRFVFLDKDFDDSGNHYNKWSLRDALRHLPYPKRHVPSFDTEHQPYNKEVDVFQIYIDTIRYGGKP